MPQSPSKVESGKSWLAGHLVSRVLTPGDPLFRSGLESCSVRGEHRSKRGSFTDFVRENLEGTGDYKFLDSVGTESPSDTRPTNTQAQGAQFDGEDVDGPGQLTPLVVGDEPGSWERKGGQLLAMTPS